MRSLEDRQALAVAARIKADEAKARKAARPKFKREPRVKHEKVREGDRGRILDPGFLAFLRRQPCAVAGRRGHVCEGRIEAAHVRYASAAAGKPLTGMQVKPDDRYCVCLCSKAHRLQHSGGERAFWATHGLDALQVAERLFAAYEAQP